MTQQEVLRLMARVLGGNIDTGEGADTFISAGPGANRTVLEGDIRIVTRLLNFLQTNIGLIDSGVKGFDDRFSEVVGSEATTDEQTFKDIGSNLIQAVRNLQIAGPGGNGAIALTEQEVRDILEDVFA